MQLSRRPKFYVTFFQLFGIKPLPFGSTAAAVSLRSWFAMSDIGRMLLKVFPRGNAMRRFDDKTYSPEQLRAEMMLRKGKRVVRKAVSHEVGAEAMG